MNAGQHLVHTFLQFSTRGRNLIERKKISAKEAVADIRSGMGDAALMKKYGLTPSGLQSLYDKLVNTGFIDLGEMQSRISGFMGTVVIPESYLHEKKNDPAAQQEKRKPGRTINAQEAARDIRLGMGDAGLTEKYQLSPKGLASLYNKLIALGMLTRTDCDRRLSDNDNTIDLREDKLSLSDALMKLGIDSSASEAVEIEPQPEPDDRTTAVDDNGNMRNPSLSKVKKEAQETRSIEASDEPSWYDRQIVLVLALAIVFPLGLYGIYRTRALSAGTKASIVGGWVLIVIGLLLTIYEFF